MYLDPLQDTKTSEPKCDLELARILADARENARKEARAWALGV